jgi:hypothetical protein
MGSYAHVRVLPQGMAQPHSVALQRIAESQRRRWLKSDLLCVVCANKREISEKAGPRG